MLFTASVIHNFSCLHHVFEALVREASKLLQCFSFICMFSCKLRIPFSCVLVRRLPITNLTDLYKIKRDFTEGLLLLKTNTKLQFCNHKSLWVNAHCCFKTSLSWCTQYSAEVFF